MITFIIILSTYNHNAHDTVPNSASPYLPTLSMPLSGSDFLTLWKKPAFSRGGVFHSFRKSSAYEEKKKKIWRSVGPVQLTRDAQPLRPWPQCLTVAIGSGSLNVRLTPRTAHLTQLPPLWQRIPEVSTNTLHSLVYDTVQKDCQLSTGHKNMHSL